MTITCDKFSCSLPTRITGFGPGDQDGGEYDDAGDQDGGEYDDQDFDPDGDGPNGNQLKATENDNPDMIIQEQ